MDVSFIKDDDLLKNIIILGITSVLISKKNLIASMSKIYFFKTKVKSHDDQER